MSLQAILPEPTEVGELLTKELDFLRSQNQKLLVRNQDVFTTQYFDLRHKEFTDNWSFDISPNWVISIKENSDIGSDSQRDFTNNAGVGIIGGEIEVKDGKLTQYAFNLTILAQSESETREKHAEHVEQPCCWSDFEGSWRVARRYHFDIDIGPDTEDPKPISHLQIGGKFDSSHVKGYDPHYCLSPLEKPRIPHPPMDPVLILHMLSSQYPTLRSMKQNGWQNRVREAESVLWEPYHVQIGRQYDNGQIDRPFAEYIDNREGL